MLVVLLRLARCRLDRSCCGETETLQCFAFEENLSVLDRYPWWEIANLANILGNFNKICAFLIEKVLPKLITKIPFFVAVTNY